MLLLECQKLTKDASSLLLGAFVILFMELVGCVMQKLCACKRLQRQR